MNDFEHIPYRVVTGHTESYNTRYSDSKSAQHEPYFYEQSDPPLKTAVLTISGKTTANNKPSSNLGSKRVACTMDGSKSNVFCIGDIHGCLDKLRTLIELLPIDREVDTLVFLGDYINRGPDSAKVIDLLLEIEKTYHRVIFLKGNHEQVLLEYAETSDVDLVSSLRMMGIDATTKNYGANVHSLQGLSCFPEEHRQFFRSLRFAWSWNTYIFTHADITDELIDRQLSNKESVQLHVEGEAQLLCGRRFWEHEATRNDVTVIFGHTPFLTPLVLPHRICIDTGAVYGNMLTAVELPSMRFYHA